MADRSIFRGLWLLLLVVCLLSAAAAEDTEEEGMKYVNELSEYLEYDQLDELLLSSDDTNDLSFSGFVSDILTGAEELSVGSVLRLLANRMLQSFQADTGFFARLFLIITAATLFSVVSSAFSNGQVAQTGFQVTFFLLYALLLQCYLQAAELAAATLNFLLQFMRMLLPVYLMSITFCTGVTTANGFYQVYVALITLCQSVLVSVFLPLCNLYVMLGISGQLPIENCLSGFTGLVKRCILWGKRGMLAAATGFSVIQGVLAPGVDQLKRSALTKSLASIPGVGALFSGVTETVFSAGVVIKNAVGTAGVLVLLFACLRPLVKLFAYMLMFRIVAAAAQLFADRRMVGCVEETAEAISLLMGLVSAAMLSFLIVIMVMAVTTAGG